MKPTLCLLLTDSTLFLVGCTTVKEHSSPVELRPAANSKSGTGSARTSMWAGSTPGRPTGGRTREDILFATEETTRGDHTVTLEFTSTARRAWRDSASSG